MLENTYYKLHHNKDFTVGFFGGSITLGTGASDEERYSWRARTREWLRETNPDVRVHEVNASIGGTGSMFGAYRCDEELSQYHPDLVFIEYATNDGGKPYEHCITHMEAIIRKLLIANPTCDIVLIYTMTTYSARDVEAGNPYDTRDAHRRVGYHYGLMQIDVGEPLHVAVIREGGDWVRYTKEGVHPNDEGYRICFEVVRDRMNEEFAKCEKNGVAGLTDHVMPAMLIENNPRMNAHLVDIYQAETDGNWTRVNEALCGHYPHYLESDVPGATLRFPFHGTCVGLYLMMALDAGNFEFRVDGGEWEKMGTFGMFCLDPYFAHVPTGWLMAEDLPLGDHIFEVRVLDEIPEHSIGKYLRFAAFLVC